MRIITCEETFAEVELTIEDLKFHGCDDISGLSDTVFNKLYSSVVVLLKNTPFIQSMDNVQEKEVVFTLTPTSNGTFIFGIRGIDEEDTWEDIIQKINGKAEKYCCSFCEFKKNMTIVIARAASLDALIDFSSTVISRYEFIGYSSLFKVDNEYHLLIDTRNPQYVLSVRAICNEFFSTTITVPLTVTHYREHMEVILNEYAIEKLNLVGSKSI